MGAPKLRWTPEEEAALKSGVLKHGTGKWRTILSDPQYNSILKSRSNVDLKDKWRNINVTAIWGSRKKAKLALKRTPLSGPKQDDDGDNITALSIVALANGDGNDDGGGGRVDPTSPPPSGSCESFTSVDKIILETITNLKRPFGPDGKSIVLYIEENFKMQPDMKGLVSSRLKYLTNVGALIKNRHRYRISPNCMAAEAKQRSPQLYLEGNKENSPKPVENGVSKPQVDGELFMIKGMTAQEAAAAAARALAEAEFAIAEAEEAAKEADEAEAQAEAAHIFAKAAMKALKHRMHTQTR